MNAAKMKGAYYTPEAVARSLIAWVVREPNDCVLDPACGDGRFLAVHPKAMGVESDSAAATQAGQRAPWASIHEGDFFEWASGTDRRFECAAGNPPFIRYQTFKGEVRNRALALCARHGARFTGLASSWAPFIVAASTLLKPGGRIAFVVPAEIGHAPYARPVIDYLISHFGSVHIIAIKTKLFPDLSEDCWLLHAEDFGCSTSTISFTALEQFSPSDEPPKTAIAIDVDEWRRDWNSRLRPFLMSKSIRAAYREFARKPGTATLGSVAYIGIGYVTGDNDFFHLRPSQIDALKIPPQFLHSSVRNGRALPPDRLAHSMVQKWWRDDEPILLLKLPKSGTVPNEVRRYLDSADGHTARLAFKCRSRDPWYSVPDVIVPEYFLSYMTGTKPLLVANDAGCVCTNSVHAVRLKSSAVAPTLVESWRNPIVELSCEIEGHPLGGGMLKLEPKEAARVLLPASRSRPSPAIDELIAEGIRQMREWRHVG